MQLCDLLFHLVFVESVTSAPPFLSFPTSAICHASDSTELSWLFHVQLCGGHQNIGQTWANHGKPRKKHLWLKNTQDISRSREVSLRANPAYIYIYTIYIYIHTHSSHEHVVLMTDNMGALLSEGNVVFRFPLASLQILRANQWPNRFRYKCNCLWTSGSEYIYIYINNDI